VMMYVSHGAYHMIRFPRPSPSVFAYCMQSKTGSVEGLETRLPGKCKDA